MKTLLKNIFLLTIISIVFITLISIQHTSAQEAIEVVPAKLITTKGEVTSLKVNIFQAKSADVLKAWQKTILDNNKVKAKAGVGEFNVSSVVLKQITEEPLNIYSTIAQYPWGVELNVAFETKGGFISQGFDQVLLYHNASNYLQNFAVKQYQKAVSSELKAEQKTLRKINRHYDKLMNEYAALQKKVSSHSQNIVNLEGEIESKSALRDQKSVQIAEQKTAISKIKIDPELKKAEKSRLRTLENERKKILNEIKNDHKKIVSNQVAIQKAQRDISINEEQQAAVNQEMRQQMQKIAEIELRLKNIK